jgi:hypothetical protein
MPGFVEMLIVVTVAAVPWLLAVWFVRYLIEMSRERRRLRLEVSKLAHEIEAMRADHGDSARESG